MKNLISSRELYFEVCKKIKNGNDAIEAYEGYFEYLDFIYQTLELGFFIACNKDGEPMVEPSGFSLQENFGIEPQYQATKDKYKEYQKALESVLFEGWKLSTSYKLDHFDVVRNGIRRIEIFRYDTIESVITSGIDLTPTNTTRKMIGQ